MTLKEICWSSFIKCFTDDSTNEKLARIGTIFKKINVSFIIHFCQVKSFQGNLKL